MSDLPQSDEELLIPRQASDVVTFGQDYGRVLSDGRIVGRAEAFAKVFPSSRAVKRAVGVTAWAILEDIALDASLDAEGRLVAETNVRHIADNIGLSKNTVAKHLGRLREHGFVLHEEQRDDGTGRYETSRYVLDPSACVERFTITPTKRETSRRDGPVDPRPKKRDTGPRRKNRDTDGASSQTAGHRDLGRKNKKVVGERDPQPPPTQGLIHRLTALGLAPDRATELVRAHPAEQVVDALDAVEVQQVRSPAGWVVAAVTGGWDVSAAADERRKQRAARRRRADEEARRLRAEQRQDEARRRADGWAAVVSAALDDIQLREAIGRVTTDLPALGRRSAPMVRAQLIGWAIAVHRSAPGGGLTAALLEQLPRAKPVRIDTDGEIPAPPPANPDRPLDERISACLRQTEPQLQTAVNEEEAR